MKHRLYLLLFVLIMTTFVSVSVLVSSQKSAIYEEPNTLSPGYYFFKTNDYRMGPVHPPLSYKLGALPLLALGPEFPYSSPYCKELLYYVCAIEFLYRSGNNGDALVFIGRLPFILLGAVLGFFVFLWAKSLYGVKAGLLALFLYAFNPAIVAWMGIILNEATVIALIFINLFFLARFVRKPGKVSMLLVAITFGLAQASKITALFLFPVYLAAAIYMYRKGAAVPLVPFLPRLINRLSMKMKRERLKKALRLSYNFLLIFVAAYFVVWAIYGFQFTTFEKGAYPRHVQVLESAVDSAFPQPSLVNTAADFVVNKVPFPFVTYFDGIGEWIYMSSQSTKVSFFNGEIYNGGKWQFHSLELLVKTPIPTLLLLLLAVSTYRRVRARFRFDEVMMLFFAAIFAFMFIFVIQWNFGISHLLPVFPFLFVFISRVARLRFKLAYAFIGVMIVWQLFGFAAAYPNYISYFNEFIGKDGGYQYFAGGNNDVGQDLKPLANYLKEKKISHVYLSYLGTVPPEYYGINYSYMPSPYFQPWVPEYYPLAEDLPENYSEDCSIRKGIVAISIVNLQNVYLLNKTCYDWLKEYEPIERIGGTIFVYNIT